MYQAGQDLGGYVLERLLGKGGMAWVWLARQTSIQRQVAVKILFDHLADEPPIVARFEREARTAGMMKHPNIGQVYEYGRYGHAPFIVLEYIDGQNLRQWIEEHGRPPVEIALLVLLHVARGLEHAHAPGRDVVHRDLKPLNVMFSKDGEVKLLDFGLARALSEDIFKTKTEGFVAGTVPYMSPEQAAGRIPEGEAGKLSDMFSLGIVFYELLAGRRPFLGEQPSEITRAIQSVDPPSLRELNPLLPPEVVSLVRDMLQKAPQHRVQKVSQVVEVLEGALEKLGVRREAARLREYVSDPAGTAERLRKLAIEQHLQRGLHFRTLGHTGVEDALREFQQVVYLDRRNALASKHVRELESEIRHRRDRQQREETTVPDALGEHGRAGELEETLPEGGGKRRRPGRWPMVLFPLLLVVMAGVGYAIAHRDDWWPVPGPTPPDSVQVVAADSIPSVGPPDATANLTLSVSPPTAEVSLDRGPGTFARDFRDLREGQHELMARADGYVGLKRAIVIRGGRDTTLELRLAEVPKAPPEAGFLKVVSRTDYYGQIWIDGVDTGKQTAAVLRLVAGEHRVSLTHPGFRTLEGTVVVQVAPGDTLLMKFTVVRDE